MKIFLYSITVALLALASSPLQANEQDQVNQAASTIRTFKTIPEKSIPPYVLRNAKGLAIITVAKGGFIFSGKVGQGVVVARTADGWSGPSFVKTGGAGFGAQIGGEVTDFVVILNTRDAVRAFAKGGNVQLGGALSVAAGPVGRTAAGDVTVKAAVYTYSRSKGLFAGASLEGAVIGTDKSANEDYYGKAVSSTSILNGKTAAPAGASVLLRALSR
jgi:lipid-binding SYLF domain-containing protein